VIEDAVRLALAPLLDPIAAELRTQRNQICWLCRTLAPGRWMSRAEATREFGVSVDTMDLRIADGALRCRRVGRSVRVLIEAPGRDNQATVADEAGWVFLPSSPRRGRSEDAQAVPRRGRVMSGSRTSESS
jgi:hypothetical protein